METYPDTDGRRPFETCYDLPAYGGPERDATLASICDYLDRLLEGSFDEVQRQYGIPPDPEDLYAIWWEYNCRLAIDYRGMCARISELEQAAAAADARGQRDCASAINDIDFDMRYMANLYSRRRTMVITKSQNRRLRDELYAELFGNEAAAVEDRESRPKRLCYA